MNQLSACLTYENVLLDPAGRSTPGAPGEQQDSFRAREYSVPAPTATAEDMAFWSRAYDLRWVGYPSWEKEARDAQMARAIEDAVLAERNRLARELHDAVSQRLFAASLIAETLPDLWEMDEAEAYKSAEELRQLTRGALAEMRTLLFELRPAALQQARLADLLKQLSEAMMGRKRMTICLDLQGDCGIPAEPKVEIYRIAQESLNNIIKYACATRVEIHVRMEADRVAMQITDNGAGFDPTCVKPGSLGLRMMRERAEAIGAALQVTSQPGQGTTVRLDWHN
jgi:signal transduction histidine kinase